jgi:hypothetical protein
LALTFAWPGTNIVADRYPAQNYSSSIPWATVPPTASELANATVDATYSSAGHPCLFILAPPGNNTAPPAAVALSTNTKYVLYFSEFCGMNFIVVISKLSLEVRPYFYMPFIRQQMIV